MRKHPYDFITLGSTRIIKDHIAAFSEGGQSLKGQLYIHTDGGIINVQDPDGEHFATLVDTFTSVDEPYDALISTITGRPPFTNSNVKEQAQAFVARPSDVNGFDPKPETRGDLRAEIHRLNTRLERQAATIFDQRRLIATKDETIIALGKKISDRDAKNAELDGLLTDMNEAYDVARADATKLSGQRDEALRDLQHNRGLVTDLRSTVADMTVRMKKLEEALTTDTGESLERVRAERNDLRIQLNRIRTITSVVKD